jgi:hypothetical protein
MEPLQNTEKQDIKSSEQYSTRMFLFALELIPYFGVPALVGLYVNKRILESYPETNVPVTALIFISTYICSWVLVVIRYRSIKSQLKK